MIESDIDYLYCPKCKSNMFFSDVAKDVHGAVVSGVGICKTCHTRFPVVDYVMILVPQDAARKLLPEDIYHQYSVHTQADENAAEQYNRDIIKSGNNWNEQMGNVFQITSEALAGDGFWGKDSFWEFCGLHPSELVDKFVCVYCGGSGREAYHLLHTKAQKVFVIDVGAHIFNINKLCEEDSTRLILLMTDFYHSPIKFNCVDISICDHALQHIENNKKAYAYISDNTKPSGFISVCVYSHENNFLMTSIVEPLKKILHKLSNKHLMALSLLPSVAFYITYKTYSFFPSSSKKFISKLPYYDLFALWGKDGFSKFHEACFDLLHAPISHHFRKSELQHMASQNSLDIVKLTMINKTMWTMVAKKASTNTDMI